MLLPMGHVHDDSDPECSPCPPSQPQIASGPRRQVSLGLSPRRAAPGGRAAYPRRAARAFGPPPCGSPQCHAGTGGSCRARRRVIVVDASALLEALLQTPAAAAVEERLFDV